MAKSVGQRSAPFSSVLSRPGDLSPSLSAAVRSDQPFDSRYFLGSMPKRSDIRNFESRASYPIIGADSTAYPEHNPAMTGDWFIKEWMALAGKRQANLVAELGWTRRKASEVFNGDQPYKRDLVNEISAWLEIEPFELLMPPDAAFQLRQLREAAVAIAATQQPAKEKGRDHHLDPSPEKRTKASRNGSVSA